MNRTEHLLTCLAEECAEVQQAVAKALRFGLGDGYPGALTTNAQDISHEFSDVLAIIEMLEAENLIERQHDTHAIERKKGRVLAFMEYAEERGTLGSNVEFSGTPAALSPEAPLERRVGPGVQED